ncbi:uncharacterized protein N7498_009340 [Penicillium cinerascens]|uniref:Protein kinase domain-containing protein n=1 Tax=Penicillium cinerascens TaxID=70096 RepID=A0A9W9J4R7_9EURO|nr:uncharacterized protein N7498_009340 [Penicillium cinerascens]KAJ5190355.1 hypothetical protein N7498_009340 [Penicillium cinerascens]
MVVSFLRSLPRLGRRWTPFSFSNPNFIRLPTGQAIEEETIPGYVAGRYYPTRIGEILKDRYQVVGKLGFGASSTVWLARDMEYHSYVTLKLFIKSTSMGQQLDDELNIYKRIEGASQKHPGRKYVRSLLDSFDVNGPEDKHRCLVHPPLWESVLSFLFRDFEENELQSPCPRKELDGRTIYTSRELGIPNQPCAPILCDFGSAVLGDEEHSEDIQPDIYRAPEVILEIPWTYSVDIWNVGCMVWNLFEGGSLFSGQDPEFQTYRSRAHLAEMIRLLGPPPPSFLARGNLTQKFFSEEGDFCAGVSVGEYTPLEQRETSLEGEDKEKFLRLVRKMLQWEPERRSSAKELEKDEWLQTELNK